MHALQKKMYEFQRQHPIASVSKTLREIRRNIISILVTLFVGASSEAIPFHLLIYIGIPLIFVIGVVAWWRFQYKIEDGELHIRSGIFVRKNLYLTRDRVQVIDISSGVLQRLFGLVKVDIQTAGSTSRDASIEAVTAEKADLINRLLRNGAQQKSADEEAESVESEKSKVYSLPGKHLLIAATTSGRFGIILSVMGTIFSQIEPVIRESEIFDYLFSMLPSQTDGIMIASIIIIVIVAAWIFSFFSTLLMYGDFSVEVKKEEIVIMRGIFEKKRITVPYNRIQAIYVNEGLVRQPLGYASAHLESAGYGDDKGTGSLMLFPLIPRKKVEKLIKEIVPQHDVKIDGYTPPFKTLRRYIFRAAFIILLITGLVYYFLYNAAWIWIFPALSIFWGWLKYKDAGIGWDRDNIILRSRTLSKTTAIIKRNRIQDISINQSPIQRYRNLCTIQVYVASGDHGKSFSVKDLDYDDVQMLYVDLQKRKEKETERELTIPQRKAETTLPGWKVNVA